jgi:transposase
MDMPRRNGYALMEKRCVGRQNWHAKGRLNVIGALLASCWLTVTFFSGSINANTFYAWVVQDLLPQLPPHSVMVMDNATFHQRADIRQLFDRARHLLESLPAYSPDLNPIEHQWAQAKAIRKQKNCSIEDLFAHYVL